MIGISSPIDLELADIDTAVRLLKVHPALLHIPLVSGNWGPPMSHAANRGQLKRVEALAELGAEDFQPAFDRAVLQVRRTAHAGSTRTTLSCFRES